MNHPDFQCSIEDNSGILIVIHVIQAGKASSSSLPPQQWQGVMDAITRYRQLAFENTPREITFRYQIRQSCSKQDTTSQQIHRRVFGLVCVAVAPMGGDAEADKREILHQYHGYLAHYGPTILETRCIVLQDASPERRRNPLEKKDSSHDAAAGQRNGMPSINKSIEAEHGEVKGLLINQSSTGSNGMLGVDLPRPVHKSFSEANLTTAAETSASAVKIGKTYIEIRLQESYGDRVAQVIFFSNF